jgi:hypothetical protein
MGFVAALLAWGIGPRTAHADNCLTQPNSSAPAGARWYYHTDRATQRKCWYLRGPDQPAQQPAAQTTSQATTTNPIPLEKPATASRAAPMSVTPDADAPPQPHIKMLSVVNSGATDLVQQRAKQQNTTSITASPAQEESTSRTGVQATEPARAAAIVWPNPPTPPMATVQDAIATPTAAPTEPAPTESVQSARASIQDAEDTAQAGAATNSAAESRASVVSEPVAMTLVVVLGLMVAGFLSRVAMIARRRRIIIDLSESHWMDDRNEHELRHRLKQSGSAHQWNKFIDNFGVQPESDRADNQNEYELRDRQKWSGSAHQWDKLTNDLQRPVIPTPTTSDYRPRPFQNNYVSREKPQRRDRDSEVADEIGKREDTLEQLKRDLDRLLRSPKVA